MIKCFSENTEKPISFIRATRRKFLSIGNDPGEKGCGLVALKTNPPQHPSGFETFFIFT